MEIKGISGVISTYKTTKAQAPKKTSAAVSAKNTDRVEFGFAKSLEAAKAAIAQEVRQDASLDEIRDAQKTLENDVSSDELAALFFMG
ncbi:MAG: hypothetical protein ACI4JS_11890 [Oscillospiraceae bacterium]